jgi:hypothetical protein
MQTPSGLDLLIIQAEEDIPAGMAVTIHYDRRASDSEKRNRLTFWRWPRHGDAPNLPPPTGSKLHRIQCGCARNCPNKLWREEVREGPLDIRDRPPPRRSVLNLSRHEQTFPHEGNDVKQHDTELFTEQLIVPPRVGDPLDLDPDVHYFSSMSECNMWDRLDGLKAEDNDLDDALRDLRDLWPEDPATIGKAGADNNTGNGTEDLVLPQGSTLQLASPVLAGPASAEPREVAEIVEVDTPRTEAGGNVSTVTGHGSLVLTRAAPSNIHQAEAALSQFDWSTLWGPRLSVTRNERLARRRRLPGPPAGWGWVDEILKCFPTLGDQCCGKTGVAAARVLPPVLYPSTAHTTKSLPVRTQNPGAKSSPDETLKILGTLTSGALAQPPISEPARENPTKRSLYNHTLQNMGNTCFFNSALQVVASIDLFVAAIERITLPPDHTGDSYCLAFLKLFIPAIAEQSSQPNTVLNISSVRSGGLPMGYADWMDFVLRLTRQYDPQYTLGDCADPGDLLDHISSLIPEIGQLCTTEFRWSTTFPCACGETTRESTVREQGN